MNKLWDQAKIQQLINDEVQESLVLEYKASGALGGSDNKKKEITKDVSSMANSAGGTIIYGVREYQESGKEYLPEKIDPVDRTKFSKERLEQVINNIRPRIDGIVITPVTIDNCDNKVVYVVDIPQSDTAHQSQYKKYYKRYNFQSVPMEDHEIRDVMARQNYPKIELTFKIEKYTQHYSSGPLNTHSTAKTEYRLIIIAQNSGKIYAEYVNAFIMIPHAITHKNKFDLEEIEINNELYLQYFKMNTQRDVVDVDIGINAPINKYGPSWFNPVLPGLGHNWNIRISDKFPLKDIEDLSIKWSIFADNAPENNGEIPLEEIEIVDLREASD